MKPARLNLKRGKISLLGYKRRGPMLDGIALRQCAPTSARGAPRLLPSDGVVETGSFDRLVSAARPAATGSTRLATPRAPAARTPRRLNLGSADLTSCSSIVRCPPLMRRMCRWAVNTVRSAVAWAIEGRGVTRLLSHQVAEHVRDGRLQILLRSDEHAPLPVHIVMPQGRLSVPKVRAFVDFVVPRLRAQFACLAADIGEPNPAPPLRVKFEPFGRPCSK